MLSLIGGLLALAAAPAQNALAGVQIAQLTIRQSVIVRIQTALAPSPLKSPWREKNGPKCIAMEDIQGAAVVAPSSVDVVLDGGTRIRARFASSCPALDYYSGFYVAPTKDGRICAGRDVVRDRAGGECAVTKFRKLVPRK